MLDVPATDVSLMTRWVSEGGARVVASALTLDVEAVRAPSGLPGWTRAHVLTHLARNADAARNLLLAGRTGEPVWMYPSPSVRSEDIEAGSTRSREVLIDDLVAAGERFVVEARAMPAEAWTRTIEVTSGADSRFFPTARVLEMRLREIELHHVDLATAYTFAATPIDVLGYLLGDAAWRLHDLVPQPFTIEATDLPESAPRRSWTVGASPAVRHVRGAGPVLLAWLSGRDPGDALEATDGDPVPEVPSLG